MIGYRMLELGEVPSVKYEDEYRASDVEPWSKYPLSRGPIITRKHVGLFRRPVTHGAIRVVNQDCDRPPKGWRCSRAFGHEGPCAALQENTR